MWIDKASHMNGLVKNLVRSGYLASDLVIDAFRNVHRVDFIPESLAFEAEVDAPLPIGYEQTISQPRTVAFMLELLQLQRGQTVLDIGSGSGWTSALLAHIVSKQGKVIAIERLHALYEFGKKNIEKFGYVNEGIVECYEGDGYLGNDAYAPYDRILVSAMAEDVPESLKQQLKIGGIMVIPINDALWRVEKRDEEEFYTEKFPGFVFVPLVHIP